MSEKVTELDSISRESFGKLVTEGQISSINLRNCRSTSQDIGDVSDTINSMNGTIRILRQQVSCKDSIIEAMKERLEVLEREKDISSRQIATYEERLDYQSRMLLNYNELKESNENMEQELFILRNRSQHLESVTQSYNSIEDLYLNLSDKFNILQREHDTYRGMEENLKMTEASNIELKILVKQLQHDISKQIDESKTLSRALSVQQEIDVMHNQIENNALENQKLLHEKKMTTRSLGIISSEISTLLIFDDTEHKLNDNLDSVSESEINQMRELFKGNIQHVYSALQKILLLIKHDEDSETLINRPNNSLDVVSTAQCSSSAVENLVRWIIKLLKSLGRCHDDRFKLFNDLDSVMDTLNSSVHTVEKLNNRVLRYKNVFQVFDHTIPSLLTELDSLFNDDNNPSEKNTAAVGLLNAKFSPSDESTDLLTSKDRLVMIDRLQKRIFEFVSDFRKLKDCRELLESSRQSVYQLESSSIRLKQDHAQELERFRNEIHDYQRICAESEEAVRVLEIESKSEIHRIKENFDAKLSLKLQEMALGNSESLHDESINDAQVKNLSVCLHRLLIHTLQLQGKYLDVVTQKTVLMRLYHGFFSLRKDVEILAHGCTSSNNLANCYEGESFDEFNSAIDNDRLSTDYDFNIVGMTRYRSESNRSIKTIRVVAIFILAALRWRKLPNDKAMYSFSHKFKDESSIYLTPSYKSLYTSNQDRSKIDQKNKGSKKFSPFDINVDTDFHMSSESRIRICSFSRHRIPLHPGDWILPSHAELEHVPLHSAMDNIIYALTTLPTTASYKQYSQKNDSHSTPLSKKLSTSSTSHFSTPSAKSLLDIICSKSYDHILRRSLVSESQRSKRNLEFRQCHRTQDNKLDISFQSENDRMLKRIWYQRSGGVDLFGQYQVTVLQRALVSMSKRLRNLSEQTEFSKEHVSTLKDNNQHYAQLLNESLTALNNQAAAIELLDRQRLASSTHNFVANAEEILGRLTSNPTLTSRLEQEESIQSIRSDYSRDTNQFSKPAIVGEILAASREVPIVKFAAAYAALNKTNNSKFPVWKTTSLSRVTFSSSGMLMTNGEDLSHIREFRDNILDDDDSYHISSDDDDDVYSPILPHQVDTFLNRTAQSSDRLNRSSEFVEKDGDSSTGLNSLNNSFATAVEDYQ